MRRLYVGVLALLRIDAATIDAGRRTTNVAVYGAGNASHAQHYAATFASLRCGGHADRFLFLDEPAPASAVALAAIGVRVILADGNGAPAVLARLKEALGGRPADVLLSDAAPKLTGVRATDRAREEALLESIEALIPQLLQPGGALCLKLLEGPEARV